MLWPLAEYLYLNLQAQENIVNFRFQARLVTWAHFWESGPKLLGILGLVSRYSVGLIRRHRTEEHERCTCVLRSPDMCMRFCKASNGACTGASVTPQGSRAQECVDHLKCNAQSCEVVTHVQELSWSHGIRMIKSTCGHPNSTMAAPAHASCLSLYQVIFAKILLITFL